MGPFLFWTFEEGVSLGHFASAASDGGFSLCSAGDGYEGSLEGAN